MWVNNFLEKTKLPFLIIFEFMLLLRTISLYSLLPSRYSGVWVDINLGDGLYSKSDVFYSKK